MVKVVAEVVTVGLEEITGGEALQNDNQERQATGFRALPEGVTEIN